jgi:hypothetical protein
MSVSCVSASTPVAVRKPITADVAPVKSDPNIDNANKSKDASTAQPTQSAPLPPGQGTRIDQIL